MDVSQSAASTTCHHYALPIFHEIGNQFIGISIANYGTTGYGQNNILTFGAMHFLAHTWATCPSLKMLAIAVIYQSIQVCCSFEVHATATATISPVWSTEGRELFTTKMTRAVSTITCFDKYFCMIVKHALSYQILYTHGITFFTAKWSISYYREGRYTNWFEDLQSGEMTVRSIDCCTDILRAALCL